jgi:hypothetical protein
MQYAKPEVVVMKPALEGIALIILEKFEWWFPDRYPHCAVMTAGAYEADE